MWNTRPWWDIYKISRNMQILKWKFEENTEKFEEYIGKFWKFEGNAGKFWKFEGNTGKF